MDSVGFIYLSVFLSIIYRIKISYLYLLSVFISFFIFLYIYHINDIYFSIYLNYQIWEGVRSHGRSLRGKRQWKWCKYNTDMTLSQKNKTNKMVFFFCFSKEQTKLFKPTEGLIYKRKYHKCPSMRKQICIIDILIVKLKYHLSTLYQILPK